MTSRSSLAGQPLLSRRQAVGLVLLGVLWLYVSMARVTVLRDDGLSGRLLLTERMVLAARFCEPLPGPLKLALLALAERLEDDPRRRAVLAGEPLPTSDLARLTKGFRMMALHQRHPDAELEQQLRVMGSQAALRLNLLLVGFGALTLMVLVSLLLGKRATEEEPSPDATDPFRVLGLYGVWDVGSWTGGLIVSRWLTASPPFVVMLSGLAWTFALGLALLGSAAYRWQWRPRLSWGWGWVGPAYLLCLVAVPLANALSTSLLGATPPESGLVLFLLFRASTVETAIFAVAAILLGPLIEELIFRGWLAGGLEKRLGRARAVGVSSLLFALVHGDVAHLPALLALGAILGWFYLRSGSLFCSWCVHAMWNATSMLILLGNRA